MKKPLHLLYITGVGDQDPKGQRRAVATWKWWGVESELFRMNWSSNEPWDKKLQRLLARIDELTKTKDVGLVAVSAGATGAITAFAARTKELVGVVVIAGKVNRPYTIGANYSSKNPALVDASHASEAALKTIGTKDRRRILSRYALADETVYKPDSKIPGARNRIVPSIGHVPTITLQITLGAPSFIRFLKKQQKLPTY